MGSVGQYTQAWFPWVAHKDASADSWNRAAVASFLSMGYIENDTAVVNGWIEWDKYLDSVTWKFAHTGRKDANSGILTLKFNGTSQGTIDLYAASTTENTYIEVTGIAVTLGLKAHKMKMESKNASSANYWGTANSRAWVRTGA